MRCMAQTLGHDVHELGVNASTRRNPISEEIYNLILQYPTKTDTQLARDLNLHRHTVSKYRKKLYLGLDHHLVKNVAGKFLTHFQMGSDYMMKQIEKLEELKKQEKTIFKKGTDGQTYPETIPLEPMDILAIEKQQTVLWEKIIFMCRQGEAIEVIKMIQNGEFVRSTN